MVLQQIISLKNQTRGFWLSTSLLLVFVLSLCPQAFADSVSYTYDSLNRLTSIIYGSGDVISYSYDANGNRLTRTSTPSTVATPGIPGNVSVAAGNASATVSFTAPAGSIDNYTVTANPGGITAIGENSPILVSGLTNGTTYTFTVTASNSAGTSLASVPSSPIIPFAPIPGDLNNDGQVNLVDAILALQAIVGLKPPGIRADYASSSADVNGKQNIGLEEAIYILQCIAGLRNNPSLVLNPIGNKTIDEGSTLTFIISATEANGAAITYSVFTLPSGATFNAGTRTFSWTPTYSQSGTYQVTFTVSDYHGGYASETTTITVNNKIPVFVATDYFPLNVGDWYDYNDSATGSIHHTTVTGPINIGGIATKSVTYWDSQKDYYTSDQNGVTLYGQYIISQSFTGNIYFNTPLLLMPNNAQIGTTKVSNSSYTLSVSGNVFHVNITSTTTILGLEDVQMMNNTLKDCIKVSIQFNQSIVETGQSIPSNTIYYWFYKGVGPVKQVVGSDTDTIADSYVNGVQQTYQQIYTIQPGLTNGKDTFFGTVYVTGGAPNAEMLNIGGWGDFYYDFIEFNLDGSPSADNTLSATLYLYGAAPAGGHDPGFQINRITSSWTETGVNLTNNPTSVFYKNFGSFALGQSTWNSVDITDLYKNWKNGTYPNYGIKLVPTNNMQSNGAIASSNNADSTIRPKIIIFFTP